MDALKLADLQTLTIEYGEDWAYPHVRRVLVLARRIGAEMTYDRTAFEYAAWLHDWGAFPRYRQEGVAHPLRSRQVAESEILPKCSLPPEKVEIILEAIELHDYRDERAPRSIEALLLREADMLDLTGCIGAARDLAWGPNNLRVLMERLRGRLEGMNGRLTLPAARRIAARRFAELERFLKRMEEESFGYL